MILQVAMAQASRFDISVGLFHSSQSEECFPAFCVDLHVLVTQNNLLGIAEIHVILTTFLRQQKGLILITCLAICFSVARGKFFFLFCLP